jgi:hypothetical protein
VLRPLDPQRSEGAGNAGRRPRPWPPCSEKSTGKEPQVQPIIRHSLRDGFTAYTALSLGNRACLPPSRASFVRLTRLAPASGCQDHTALPYATVSVVRAKICALTPSRPPHPASTFVTTRTPLQSEAGRQRENHIFPKTGSRIFLREGLDSRISVELLHEIRFFGHAIPRPFRTLGDGALSVAPRREGCPISVVWTCPRH